jgi:uncharacterized membrane protein
MVLDGRPLVEVSPGKESCFRPKNGPLTSAGTIGRGRPAFHARGPTCDNGRLVSRPVALVALLLIALSWNAALVAAPRALAPAVSAVTYAAGSLICHQRPERSFQYQGAQYPVCARCLGLYAGAAGGVLLWTAVSGLGRTARARASRITQPALVRRLLIAAALPTVVTVVAAWLGWWDAGNLTRAAVALPLGATIAAVVAAVAARDLR